MAYEFIKNIIKTEQYDFLRTDPHLGKNIILLGLGGSYAYGTNTQDSDIDIRGIALNSKEEILLGRSFEQVDDKDTDTTVYALSKIIQLLTNANPNVLEMLFLDSDQYIYLSSIGQELIDNRKMFLSKKVIYTFGGYARAQLSRLDNKTMRNLDQSGQEKHILRSIQNAQAFFPEKYFEYPEDRIKLYIDDAVQPDFDTEVFMDVNLNHYPLRDYKCMWAEMHSIVKSYAKIGKRAKSALKRDINKHAMHLCRLQLVACQLLETGDMNTHRIQDHDFLMDIRNGKYMDDNGQMSEEFFDIVDELDQKMLIAAETTQLPDKPDYEKIDGFMYSVNERIVKDML